MKNIIMAAILLLLPATAFANGHINIWNMAGLGNAPSSSKIMEGKTGSIMINTSTDLWDWSEAPEGFPSLVTAECNQTVAITAEGAPFGGVGVCSMMDPDGDLAIYFGEITPQMEYVGSLTAGSGKYEPYVGQKFIGTVTGMLSTGQQMYHVVAAD
ncbi:MAG: hypothetical protein HOI17_04065 [Alphaproteobacteria bacterium]|jgi:hypothetical protein|nr:hypothetical protein [Alphaproteobacteria bacterium]